MPAAPKEIKKEELSEYFLFTVEGRDNLPAGWAKSLPSFKATNVPVTNLFKFEKERWGDQAIRFLRFKNDRASHLGTEPLPDGQVHAIALTSADGLHAYLGKASMKYAPVGEQVDLELWPDQEVRVRPVLKNWEKYDLRFDAKGLVAGWIAREHWELELQNSKALPVKVEIRRNFNGDWELTAPDPHEALDAQSVKFNVEMRAGEKRTIKYDVVLRYGTNTRR